jgi:hypothetical protein
MSLAIVAICCNHHENGNFAGRCDSVTYDDLDLVSALKGACRFSLLSGNRFRLSRRVFSYVRSKEWFGNWCWDAFWMERREAHRLVAYLRQSGWGCEGGPARLCDWYDKPTSPTSNEQ